VKSWIEIAILDGLDCFENPTIYEGRRNMLRNSLLLSACVAILGAVMAPARASTIDTDIWYAGHFGSTAGVGLSPGFVVGTSPPDGNPTMIAPAGAPWTVTLSKPGELTITDVEESGDQFTLTFTGATTGTVTTSTPVLGADVGECISCALSNPDFSSGVFALNAGTTSFVGAPVFMRAPGDFDFEVTTIVPEPSTWAMMALGFAGLGYAGYRKAKSARKAVLADC
jgi:PEP-CTERM motif-containing protein